MTAPDCLVVGTGITGWSCAAALVQTGASVVVVADQRQRASSVPVATLVPPLGRRAQRPLGQLAQVSYARYPVWCATLAATTGHDPQFRPLGMLRLCRHQPHVLYDNQQWLDWVHMQQYSALALPIDIIGAIQTGDAATVAAPALLAGLERQVRAGGGQIVVGRVRHVLHADTRIVGVHLDDGQHLVAPTTILATGMGTKALLAPLGVDLPLDADGGLVVQLSDVPLPPTIVAVDRYTLTPHTDGTLWVSGIRHLDPYDHEAGQVAAATLALVGQTTLRTTTRATVRQVWQGVRPRAPGSLPYLGPVPGYDGCVLAVGHGPNGFLLAPITAAIIADGVQRGLWHTFGAACDPRSRCSTTHSR